MNKEEFHEELKAIANEPDPEQRSKAATALGLSLLASAPPVHAVADARRSRGFSGYPSRELSRRKKARAQKPAGAKGRKNKKRKKARKS